MVVASVVAVMEEAATEVAMAECSVAAGSAQGRSAAVTVAADLATAE